MRHGRSSYRVDRAPRHRDRSATQKFKDLDAQIDAINTGASALSKVDKYIAVEKLAEAKCIRRGRVDHKRKKPDSRLAEHKDEEQIDDLIKRGYLGKYVDDRPCPDFPNRRYGDNRPTARDIQVIHGGFGLGECSSLSRKRHARSVNRQAKEEVYSLSTPVAGTHHPISFTNNKLRGLHLPHNYALVISAIIANFNVQRNLVDNGSSTDILFISAFNKIKIGRDKLHPFHTPLVGFRGNATHPLGWIKGVGAPPDHSMARFYCCGLPFTLQCNPRSPNIGRDQGHHFNLLPDDEVFHFDRGRRDEGQPKSC
ncbi:hypothetical protein Acr_00g0045450 [Actinidia rufa]|uniref:Uncharacterized protein n=1 Tax=Actinidia rufa TaxID=165716 RepID=A0A7J0DL08_9ERIC|nr:hypothetical protein Acr_00g0045450 [Actinidia rufa]